MTTAQAALSGILVGGLYALMAMGLSLTWRMLKIINLAHFGLILLGAYLTYQMATSWGLDPLLTPLVSAPVLFVASAVLYWVFDRLAISELNSLLVSFGVLVITIQATSNIWSEDFRRITAEQNRYATQSVRIGEFVFPVPTLLAFAAAVVLTLAIHVTLRRTFIGRALRAFAEDRTVAAAFGIDHRRLGALLAGLAGASAAVAGLLWALSNAITPSTPFAWFGIVFAVVILGGIGNVAGTLLAGVLVGTLSSVVSVVWSAAAAPLAVFSAIILALLFRPEGLLPAGDAAVKRGFTGIGAAVAALAVLPFVRESLGLTGFYVVILYTIFFWTAQATSWNVLSGYAGYFSFGQGAFVGLGAYTAAVLSGRHDVAYFVTIPIAGVLGVALALAIGTLAFRLRSFRGEIFALLTLSVPFILASVARLSTRIDGGQGIIVPSPEYPGVLGDFQDLLYLLNLAIAALAVGIAYTIQNSRFGWALAAVRDAEDIGEGLGVPTFRYKMLAIAASGLIGSMSGAAYAQQIGFVTVEAVFGLTIPVYVIVMSVLGGRTHWLGPVIGATFIVLLQDRLTVAGLEGWRMIIFGAILAFVVVAAPEGLQARLKARPFPALGAFVVFAVGSRVIGGTQELLDWVGAGMVGAAIVALWPGGQRQAARLAAPLLPSQPAEPIGPAELAIDPVGDPSPGAVPIIECAGLSRHFGGVRALDGLTVTISAGDLVGLVGPNGSGKTTLVNLLSRTLRPTHGEIRIAGHDIAGLPPHRVAHAGVARTYQIPRPFPSMTVRDNVAMAIMFGRASRPIGAARAAAQEHLDFVGLAHLADAFPDETNLHERQLLEMARAIASSPKVLLLDEALAGLNPAEIDNAVEVVRRIHRSGITIVIVEHLLRVVNQLATRVVVLDRGRLLADGTPQTVMREPAVVRAYLGKVADA